MADISKVQNFEPAHAFCNDLDYVELKVAGVTTPRELAGSIAFHLEKQKIVALAAIGHQAIGQALKAIPILNTMTVAHGYIMGVLPWFDIKIVANPVSGGPGQERTAVMMHLIKIRPF